MITKTPSLPPVFPTSGKLISDIRPRLFGTSTWKQVLLRMAVDLSVANLVLVMAAVLRLLVLGTVSLENPVGQLLSRINTLYLMHAGWFGGTAVALFTLSGLYKPVPSSRFVKRFFNIASACGLGLALHVGFGTLITGRAAPTVEVAVPAWTVLCLSVTLTRLSRMYWGSKYRMVPRGSAVSSSVEDVLVVGGAGYIGSVLVKLLLDSGYRVRVLDLQMYGIDPLKSMMPHPRLEVVHGDFRNIEDVVRALRGMDAVVHLAAIVGDPACALDCDATIAVNYAAAKMMAQLARAKGISRFVFASTCSVYGESEDLRDEKSELNPVSIYATTKIDAERVLMEAADDVFQPTSLRFATAYGWSYRPRFDLVANLLSAQAVTAKKITIFNGEQWRPFIHIRDIARAVLMTLEAPLKKVGAQVFNVGDDSQNYTLRQLGEIVAKAAPGTVVEEICNADDARNYRVDFTKIVRVLGFHCEVGLEDGIQEIVDAVRAGKVADWRDPIYSNRRHLEGAGKLVLKFETEASKESNDMQVTREFLSKAA